MGGKFYSGGLFSIDVKGFGRDWIRQAIKKRIAKLTYQQEGLTGLYR